MLEQMFDTGYGLRVAGFEVRGAGCGLRDAVGGNRAECMGHSAWRIEKDDLKPDTGMKWRG
jgi:hypothetical protein